MTALKHVLAATKTLTPARLEQFCRRFLGMTQPQYAQGLNDEFLLLAFVLEWLNHLGLLSDADQEVIISTYRMDLCKFPYVSEQEPKTHRSMVALTISDGRYVSLTGAAKTFLDVQTGDKLEELPRPPLTLIICNVAELFIRKKEYIAALESEHEHPSTAGINPINPTTDG
ncbi:hypothetical protein N9993_01780 [bacterium]|nr:hypothetical protein [bacterium]